MRFPQVPIGQSFTFRGRQYTKTGPLTASEEISGERCLIPKAAEVSLLDAKGKPQRELKQRYTRAEVERLLEGFKNDLIGGFQKMVDEDGTLQLKQVVELTQSQQLGD